VSAAPHTPIGQHLPFNFSWAPFLFPRHAPIDGLWGSAAADPTVLLAMSVAGWRRSTRRTSECPHNPALSPAAGSTRRFHFPLFCFTPRGELGRVSARALLPDLPSPVPTELTRRPASLPQDHQEAGDVVLRPRQGEVGALGEGGGGLQGRGAHSSITFSAQREHSLWETLCGVSVSE